MCDAQRLNKSTRAGGPTRLVLTPVPEKSYASDSDREVAWARLSNIPFDYVPPPEVDMMVITPYDAMDKWDQL